MNFNVSRLMRRPSGVVQGYDLDEEFLPEDDAEPQRVFGSVRLMKTDRGVWVSAELETGARCSCSRCLIEISQPVLISVEEEFFSKAGRNAGAQGLNVAEDNLGIDEGFVLDLTEAVRQHYALSVPFKPLCRDDCKGICASCWVDLNDAACRCERTARDIRWGPLLDLVPSPAEEEAN